MAARRPRALLSSARWHISHAIARSCCGGCSVRAPPPYARNVLSACGARVARSPRCPSADC
eukprot:4468687-Pyramimonas_sp.AAC.1